MIQSDLQGPQIKKFTRSLSALDNSGIGHTAFGERYLMRTDVRACLAEYVYVSLCKVVGIPTIEPGVIQFKGQNEFGSCLEAGMLTEEVKARGQLLERVKRCTTPNIFSAVLAVENETSSLRSTDVRID